MRDYHSPEVKGARPAESRPPRRPDHALLALQRTAGNRAVGEWVVQRSYGDPALDQAAAGELTAALGWLGGQSMTALITIMKRARPRGLLSALLTGLTGDEAHLGPAGVKRIEAVIRAVQFQAKTPTGSDRMQLKLLMDAAALPADQRAELEALLGKPKGGDGLEAKLAEGEFGTAFAMLNGMNMTGLLTRLTQLGRAWHSYLVANLSAADPLGPHSRGRIQVALIAVNLAMENKATADDLLQLKSKMTEIGLPSDQQQDVLAVAPKATGGDVESIASYFQNVALAPLLLPWAVERSFRLLDGKTPDQIASTGQKVSDDILKALVSNSRWAQGHDAEAIRQGLQRAWTIRFPGTAPPWDVGRPATVADMSAADKLVKALDASGKHLRPEFAARIQELKTPESIAMMAAFTTVYVASQLTPAGWVADVLVGGLIVAGVIMGGMEALEIIKHVAAFLSTAVNATSEPEFEVAGNHLATAVTKLGVDVVMAILLHRVGKGATGVGKKVLAGGLPKFEMPSFKLGLVTPEGVVIPDLPLETLQTKGGGSGGPKKVTGPAGGQVLYEGARADGTTVIRSRVGKSPGRLGTEDLLPSSVEVDVPGWERAHSQGNITGAESAQGIRYAPKEVNQSLQRLGIERAIRDLFSQKAPGVEVIMTTETRAHPGSLRLAEIAYRIDLKKPSGATMRVYEASIEVQNTTQSPRCTPSAERIGWDLLETNGWLKALPK